MDIWKCKHAKVMCWFDDTKEFDFDKDGIPHTQLGIWKTPFEAECTLINMRDYLELRSNVVLYYCDSERQKECCFFEEIKPGYPGQPAQNKDED